MPSTGKPASSLTEQDLIDRPVWRFVQPGELPDADESYVVGQAAPPEQGDNASYLVGASYELDDGTRLPGIVQVDMLGRHVETTPVIAFAAGKSVEILGRDTAARLGRILKCEARRPVRWTLDVTISGESRRRGEVIPKAGLAQAFSLLVRLARLKRMR